MQHIQELIRSYEPRRSFPYSSCSCLTSFHRDLAPVVEQGPLTLPLLPCRLHIRRRCCFHIRCCSRYHIHHHDGDDDVRSRCRNHYCSRSRSHMKTSLHNHRTAFLHSRTTRRRNRRHGDGDHQTSHHGCRRCRGFGHRHGCRSCH